MQADTREQASVVRITMVTPSGTQVVNYTLRETKMTTIGRAPDNVIVINNLHISKYHCTIELRHGHFHLFDHSLNGTWLNGQKLSHGDRGCQLRSKDVRAVALLPTAAASPCSAVTPCASTHAREFACARR